MKMDSKRRDFIQLALGVGAGLLAPAWARASEAPQVAVAAMSAKEAAFAKSNDALFWSQPRTLTLSRRGVGELKEVCYWANGKVQWDGYAQVCRILADWHAREAVQMDPRLMDLMRAVQAYVAFYGYDVPISINSGFRSLTTNQNTEGAARNSMHLYGKAVDFTMAGLPSDFMGLLASHYQGGGVGFYAAQHFTHMDTGNVRYWAGRGSRAPALLRDIAGR